MDKGSPNSRGVLAEPRAREVCIHRQRHPLPGLEVFTPGAISVILEGSGRAASVGGTRLNQPTATKGGDPSGSYKRWFGRVSWRAGWWRGSSLVGTSCWLEGHRGTRAGSSPRVRPCPTDGRSDAVAVWMTLVLRCNASSRNGGIREGSAVFLLALHRPCFQARPTPFVGGAIDPTIWESTTIQRLSG